jgi:hypothetical protein
MGGEFQTAELQGVKNPRKKGLVFAFNSKGKIIKRGVGQPPWKELVESFQ